MYQFRANGQLGRDERIPYTPSQEHLSGAPGTFKYGADTYRPASSSFSFSIEPPPSIDLSRMSDSYRPQPPRSNGHSAEHRNGHAAASRYDRPQRYRGRGGGRFVQRAAERPFLHTNRDPTPELMPGMEEEDANGVKYRALEDMSDSDEADMDLSSDEDNQPSDETSEEPKKKQARTEGKKSVDGDSVPRWSNPDPYTALPPIDDSQRKKLDVVKLIRKARVVNASDAAQKTDAVTDDFISFDFDDNEVQSQQEPADTAQAEAAPGMPGAPTGPRGQQAYSHREEVKKLLVPSQPVEGKTFGMGKTSIQMKMDTTSDPALGSRKRNIDDEIKDAPLIPSMVKKPTPQGPASGAVLKEWRFVPGENPAPWCTVDHAATANMGHW
jgi:non-canonical poly(A) RNA polymerase PAPD5/7